MRARAEMRARWRTWVMIGVLVGMAGGVSLAALAGARRTESAYPRFLQAQRALDVLADVRDERGMPAPIGDVLALPSVEDATTALALFAAEINAGERRLIFPDVFPIVSRDGRFATEINVSKVMQGRRPRPERVHEVLVGFTVAETFGVELGDRLKMKLYGFDEENQSPDQTVVAEMDLHVVGIGGMPGEFQTLAGASIPTVHLTPAFLRRYEAAISPDEAFAIRLRNGHADLPAFQREAERAGYRVEAFFEQRIQTDSVQRSARFQAFALWLLGGLVALAALAVLGQALVRQASLESSDHPVLRALGMRARDLVAVGLARSLVISSIAAAVAAGSAIALSPLAPVGLAGLAEPAPGVHADILVIGIGAVAICVFVAVASALAEWRAGRRIQTRGERALRTDPSQLAEAASRSGLPAPVVAGLRLALDAGRGDVMVPVRSTVIGVALGIVAVASALTFAGGMNHLTSTPKLSGWTFDLLAGGPPDQLTAFVRELEKGGDVDAYIDAMTPGLLIEETDIIDAGLAFGPGRIGPAIAEGRAPRTADEVALGRDTMVRLGLRIGGTVRIAGREQNQGSQPVRTDPQRYRIVGRLVQPAIGFNLGSAGQGVAMTIEAVDRLGRPEMFAQSRGVFIRLKEGSDVRLIIERIGPRFPTVFVAQRRDSGTVADVSRLSGMPFTLAGILVLMAVATVAHTLLTSIRRRARDLAILRTIGFVGAQIRSTVAWQATTLVVAGLLLGLPLGIVLGRWGWLAFANSLGVLPVAVTPLFGVAVVVPAVILVGNLVALIPARTAARTEPASVFRKE
ncbi:MAG TPA: FtsX-like permease family protein [Actinomycetota bacterium]|nr:FtsX-like permease family protein [Actinomycetota bacterium]